MELDLTAEQHDVVAAFERALSRESSIARVRAAESTGHDATLWNVLSQMGSTGLAVPVSAGGAGSDLLDFVLVAECFGRHLGCAPLVESAAAAALHAAVGGQQQVLTQLLDGGPLVVLSPRPAQDGVARLVPGGSVAQAVVALDGDELVLVDSGPAPLVPDFGFTACADRPLRGEAVQRIVLADGARARELWRGAIGWWRLATAAVLVGVAERALTVAVDYAKEREQFGVPIGSFQAIQHMLATVVMAVDGGRLLVRETAWRHDERDAGWLAAADIAFAHAARTAVQAGEACLHVHGGYGYTLEYDAQLYLRRAKALQLHAGDPEQLWEAVGAVAAQQGV